MTPSMSTHKKNSKYDKRKKVIIYRTLKITYTACTFNIYFLKIGKQSKTTKTVKQPNYPTVIVSHFVEFPSSTDTC